MDGGYGIRVGKCFHLMEDFLTRSKCPPRHDFSLIKASIDFKRLSLYCELTPLQDLIQADFHIRA